MAALSIAIAEAQKQRATRRNRDAHKRAALRLEEVFKSQGMADTLDLRDRPRNLKVETAFSVAYQTVDTEVEREAVLNAYLKWDADEKAERRDRHELTDDMTAMLIRDNPVFIEGAPVRDEWLADGCGPSGRAA